MHLSALLLFLCSMSLAVAAETSAQLQEQLKRYPDADTNRDGVLTIEEAQAYAKVIRKGKKGATGAGANDDGPATAASTAKKPAPTHSDTPTVRMSATSSISGSRSRIGPRRSSSTFTAEVS